MTGYDECEYGVTEGDICWQCRYDFIQKDVLWYSEEWDAAEDRADRLAVVADALAVELSEWEFDRIDADWAAETMAKMREEIKRQDSELASMVNERADAIETAKQYGEHMNTVQDERARSFKLLQDAVGQCGLTEYQPEADLEIKARIDQIQYERREMLDWIRAALPLIMSSPRYPEMAGKADRWLKEG